MRQGDRENVCYTAEEPYSLAYPDRSDLVKDYSGTRHYCVLHDSGTTSVGWPPLENLCGLWVGSWGIFLLTLKTLRCIQQDLPSH